MKRIRPPKTGRLPNPDELQIAKDWVFLYREAKKSPGGRICLNPDAESKNQQWLDGNDSEPLLQLLERFATYGTFKDISEETAAHERFMLFASYLFALQSGQSRSSIIVQLAEKLNLDQRTVERQLSMSSPPKIRDWVSKNRAK